MYGNIELCEVEGLFWEHDCLDMKGAITKRENWDNGYRIGEANPARSSVDLHLHQLNRHAFACSSSHKCLYETSFTPGSYEDTERY
jgi:hypothetical protein